jgi:hypothetical protein
MTSFSPIRKGAALVALTRIIFVGQPTTVRAQSTRENLGEWTIEYYTKAVTVVKVESTGTGDSLRTSITAQNISGRPITAVAFARGMTPRQSVKRPHSIQPAWEPGATETFNTVNWPSDLAIEVRAVLFGDGKAAGDGDPNDIESMRFYRLGQLLEETSCEAQLRALVPPLPMRGDNLLIVSAWAHDDPLWRERRQRLWETVLASFPDSPLKGELQGAGNSGKSAVLKAVKQYSEFCHWGGMDFLYKPESIRAEYLSDFRKVVEVDMGVAK